MVGKFAITYVVVREGVIYLSSIPPIDKHCDLTHTFLQKKTSDRLCDHWRV